jgi:hypothetical protein
MAEPGLQALSDAPVLGLRDSLLAPSLSSSSPHPGVIKSNCSDIASGDGHGNSYSSLAVPATPPNVLLAPLTVIIHISQYSQYLNGLRLDHGLVGADAGADGHGYIREGFAAAASDHTPDTGTDIGTGTAAQFQGLCIGTLSATAMQSSTTRAELGQNAAAAVRLAMCIGAYIDAERGLVMSGFNSDSNSDMVCFIARWGFESGRENLEAVLSQYPEVRCITCGGSIGALC